MLGRGGLLGEDATRNAARDKLQQSPGSTRPNGEPGSLSLQSVAFILAQRASVGNGGTLGGGGAGPNRRPSPNISPGER